MSFVVTPECVGLGLRAGAIVLREVRVNPSGSGLREEIRKAAAAVQRRFADAAAVRVAPEIAGFQAVLRKVGINPRREQCSVERLLNFAIKRGDLPAVNCLVDAYNLVSIRSCCSLGAHDLDRIGPPVSLQLLTGNEPFMPLGGTAASAVRAGEFGYVDAQGSVLCRLDVVQADFSKVTPETVNALLIIEGTTAHPPAALRQAFVDAAALLQAHCGGSAEIVAEAY